MELATIHVSGVNAKVVQKASVPKGIVGGYVDVIFDDDWKGLRRTAVIQGAVTLDILDVGDRFQVPQEAVAEAGVRLKIGFYGIGEDGRLGIPTLWADLGVVQDAADPSGDEAAAPALPIWAQIQTQIGNLENLDTQAKDTLVAAINEALTKGGSVDPEAIRAELEKYLEEHPIETGATEEQAAQIQKNKEDIEAILADFESVGLTVVEVQKILIPEQTVVTSAESGGFGVDGYGALLKIEEDINLPVRETTNLIVRINGVDYEATGTADLDGNYIFPVDATAGFYIGGHNKFWVFVAPLSNTKYTVSVRYRDVTETVMKLPESIIPDGFVKSVNGVKPDANGNVKIGMGNEILPETETVAIPDEDGLFAFQPVVESVTVGKTYTVKYNGVEYECIAQPFNENESNGIVLGNIEAAMGGVGTGEPFVMVVLSPEAAALGAGGFVLALDGSTSVTVGIYYGVEYAKKSDIPTKVSELENDSHYVTEEVAEQILDGYAKKSDIPTDEHINGLIDTKLEDLPSGGGGSGEVLELLADVTLTEEVNEFLVGIPTAKYKRLFAFGFDVGTNNSPNDSYAAGVDVYLADGSKVRAFQTPGFINKGAKAFFYANFDITATNMVVYGIGGRSGNLGDTYQEGSSNMDNTFGGVSKQITLETEINGISVLGCQGADRGAFGVGSKFMVWGVRA